MSGIKIFEAEAFGQVRVVDVDGEPWFVAADVTRALGYTSTNRSHILGLIPEEWKGRKKIATPGGEQEMAVLSEQGLYFFLGRSDKPAALPYQKWVAGEVLPSIRRTGQYGGYALPRVPQSFPDALRMIADIEEEKQLAIEQRDYYKRTKAEIGSRREATAMATASTATRRANRLEDSLGIGKTYKQVKAIPWLLEEFSDSRSMYQQVGKKLKNLSQRMGYEIKSVPCPEYPQGVKAYHVDVVKAFRDELQRDKNMLGRYRVNG